jgi:uncharacterized protein (TIGR03435 family)
MLVLLVVSARVAAGQPVTFEVASVKKSAIANDHPQGFRIPSPAIRGLAGDRLREPYVTLAELIMQAYDVKDYQISGLPAWGGMMGDQFDIEAKAGGAPTQAQVRVMLQGLLAQRFGLKLHRATKELAVYELSGSGSKMKEVTGEPAQPGRDSKTVRMPMETLATMLAVHLDRPIIDRTGFAGKTYEFPFDLVALARCGQGADAVNCVAQMAERNLGLKLSARKSAVELLVVDRVEKPTGN